MLAGLRKLFPFLSAYYLLAVIWGVRSALFGASAQIDLVWAIAFNLILTWWMTSDARNRGKPISIFVASWIFLLAALVVPIYVIFTRGWRGVLLLFVHAIVWYGVILASYYVTLLIMA